MNSIGEELDPQTPMPAVYNIIATVMLQNGFEPGFGLRKDSQGIIELVSLLVRDPNMVMGTSPQMMT